MVVASCAARDEERTPAVVPQQICSCHVADAAEEQVPLSWVRLIAAAQRVVVLQRNHSCCMAQALEQKVMKLFHRDCQVGPSVVGHSMMMMMMMVVEPQMKVVHTILVDYTLVA